MEKKPILLFGVADRTKVILDILEKNDFLVYGILEDDDHYHGKSQGVVTVLGKTDEPQFVELLNKECLAFIAYDDPVRYRRLLERLRNRYADVPLINVIASEASLPKRVDMGVGNFIQANSHLGAEVVLGSHNYIGPHVVIEHETTLKDFVHIAPGVLIGSQVTIGEGVDIGPGAIIGSRVSIGEGAQIPTRAVVNDDVPPHTVLPEVAMMY